MKQVFLQKRAFARLTACLLLVIGMVAGTTSVRAQDAADQFVRLNRLEGQVRQLSGQIEQLQFENKRLQDQLKRFQEDVDFRFQERANSGKQGGSPSASPTSNGQQPKPAKRGDILDPAMQMGDARLSQDVVKRSRGNSAILEEDNPSSAPGNEDGLSAFEEPLDMTGVDSLSGDRPSDTQQLQAPLTGRRNTGTSIAATGSENADDDYQRAYASLLQNQYETAEMSFRGFLQSHPRDRQVPDATYWLGESYLQQGRNREAAEQFLKVTTEHPKSSKAPDAMLKLGNSLSALGEREQACATYAAIGQKYPQAVSTLRPSIERETKRVRCTG